MPINFTEQRLLNIFICIAKRAPPSLFGFQFTISILRRSVWLWEAFVLLQVYMGASIFDRK